MKRTAPIRVISFILLATCGASCQKNPSADLLQGLQFDSSNSPEVQHGEMRPIRSLPDAPSSVRPPLTFAAVGVTAGIIRETGLVHVTLRPQPNPPTALYQATFIQQRSSNFVGKDRYPPLLNLHYLPSTSSSFMGRATDAAARIFVTRDNFGKRRLNTSYFLGVLTSVASATAYRPYWARSSSQTFNNLGSTIGSDAGINLLHEFGPGMRQIVRGLTPKFVSRIEECITHDQTPVGVAYVPAR
jgi:hypothetical protein